MRRTSLTLAVLALAASLTSHAHAILGPGGISLSTSTTAPTAPTNLTTTNLRAQYRNVYTLGAAQSGLAITQWTDLSGNGFHVTGANGTTVPSKVAAAVNGQPVADFARASSQFLSSSTPLSSLITVSAWQVYVVAKIRTVVTNNAAGWANEAITGDNNENWGIFLRSVPQVLSYLDNAGNHEADTGISLNTWMLISSALSGGELQIRINKGSWVTVASPNLVSAAGTEMVGKAGSGFYIDAQLAELAFYNAFLSTSDDTANLAYFDARYALGY